jgi:hypothetical protein
MTIKEVINKHMNAESIDEAKIKEIASDYGCNIKKINCIDGCWYIKTTVFRKTRRLQRLFNALAKENPIFQDIEIVWLG